MREVIILLTFDLMSAKAFSLVKSRVFVIRYDEPHNPQFNPLETFRNIVEIRKNADYQHFLLLSQ